jgi:hypothetical protein
MHEAPLPYGHGSVDSTTNRAVTVRERCHRLLLFVSLATVLSAQQLEPGKPIQRELAGGQSHSYTVRLEAGQFLHVVVTQLGVDVMVRLFGPDGQKLAEVDSVIGLQGPEPLFWIAQVTGDSRLEVNAKNRAANPGRYEIKLEELRTAVAGDYKRVAAQQSFREAQTSTAKD